MLRGEAARVQAGEPRLVLVSGEAGVGKTRLVERLLTEMAAWSVLRSSGDKAETDVPYGVAGQLVAEQPTTTVDGLSRTGTADTFTQPHAVGAGLLELLGDLQDSGPVGVVLDDAHWADLPSLQAVTFALRRLRADRVMALLIRRTEEDHRIPEGVDRLIENGHGSRIDLSGLTVNELRDLLQLQDQVALSPAQLERLWDHTRGNPLWATTLLDEVPPDQLASGDQPLPAPLAMARSVERRLNACSPDASALVGAAAVGGALDVGTLGALADLPDPLPALDEGVREGLLKRAGSPPAIAVRFPHPLVAAAAYDALDAAPRAALHRRAAELAPNDATRIRHEVAATTGQDAALSSHVAEHARDQRDRGDLITAASAFITAAGLSPERAASESLLLDAAETSLMTGDVGSAVRVLGEHPDLEAGRRLDYIRGWEAFATGRFDYARQLLTRACDDSADELTGAAARLLAYLELLAGNGLASASWGRRAVQLSPSGWHRNLAAGFQAMGSFIAGRTADAYAALAWVPEVPDLPPDAVDAAAIRANLRLFDDDLDRARREYFAVLSACRSSGNFLAMTHVLGNLAEIEYRTGRWDDAVGFGDRAVGVASDLDQTWVFSCVHAVASPVYARRGEWEVAEAHVRAAKQAADMLQDAASIAYAGTAAAILAHSRRDYPGVLAAVEPLVAAPSRDGFDEPGCFMWRELQVEALVRLGRLDDAEAALAPFEEAAADRDRLTVMGCAARARGLLEAARGNTKAASSALDNAVSLHRDAGVPFEQALAHLAAGGVLRRSGRRHAAVEHLQAASRICAELRAMPFVELCDQELRGCGLKPIRRQRGEITQLTPQEMSVAKLVASGLRNREVAAEMVLSVKTIEYHLGNAFTKLGVRSRTELSHRLRDAEVL